MNCHKIPIIEFVGYQDESPRLAIDSSQKDSTQKMLHLMLPGPEPVSKTIESPTEQKNLNNTPSKDVREKKDNEVREGPKFNPTPLPTSYDPFK